MRESACAAPGAPRFYLYLFGIAGVLLMAALLFCGTARASEPEVYRLANGLTVVLQQDKRFPLVSMRYYVHAGSAYETPKEAGISHLLEHMVFKGTSKRPKGGVAESIEGVGGYINAATSFDYTVYIIDVPAEHWRTGLEVLQDQAFNSTIDPSELESEKKVVIAELKRGEDSPGGRLFKYLQTSALTGTPYAHPIIGYEDVLNKITRDDIMDYIGRHYQPQSSMLLVCGDIDTAAVRKEIERLYGPLRNTHAVSQPEMVDLDRLKADGPRVKVEKGPWNKVYLGVAFPSVAQQNGRTVHLDVLTSLLADGKTSYLYRKYKYDLQLVDSISVSNYSFERMGLLYFSAVLDADKLDAFWSEFLRDLKNIDNIAFSEQELERGKLNMEDDLFRSKETLSGLASKLGYFEFFDNGVQGENNYIYAVRNVTMQDVRGQLDDLVQPQKMSVVALVPENAGKAKLDADSLKKVLNKEWPAQKGKSSAVASRNAQKTEVLDLGKGRKLIMIPDNTLPYVSASLMFTGGDALLDKNEQGLATVVAAMLTKGAGDMSANQFEDYLADRASSLNASVGRQTLSFDLSAPERFSADIFKLLKSTIDSPAFKDEELQRVKNNQISAIKSAEDQPLSLAFREISPFLFGDHPYGFRKLGQKEEVAAFTREQVTAFWNKQSRTPWVLSVCGSFDREAVVAAAKALPAPSAPEVKVAAPKWGDKKELTLELPGRHQYHLMLVFPTVPLADKDAPAVELLQSVLAGQSGLLFSELRDKQGLGYTVTAMPWNSQKAGALIFYIGTEPEKAAQAKAGFLQVIEQVCNEELPEADLQRGKNGIRGEYYRAHQSLASRSAEASTLTVLGLPLDKPHKEMAAIDKITPAQLQEIARKYLIVEDSYQVVVEP